MDLGKAIKELRKERGLNQRELASACGLTQTSLSQIESGIKRPNPSTMKKFSKYFGVPEPVFYILATESSDIPAEKQFMYQTIFPNIKNILLDLFSKEPA